MSNPPREQQLVDALLGPEGPEVTCEVCFEELDRYVELELAGEDAEKAIPGMRAHFAGCPACSEDHRSLREFLRAGEAPADRSAP